MRTMAERDIEYMESRGVTLPLQDRREAAGWFFFVWLAAMLAIGLVIFGPITESVFWTRWVNFGIFALTFLQLVSLFPLYSREELLGYVPNFFDSDDYAYYRWSAYFVIVFMVATLVVAAWSVVNTFMYQAVFYDAGWWYMGILIARVLVFLFGRSMPVKN
jgi:hypothetical protein